MNALKKYKLDELYQMSSGISTKPEQAGHGAPFCSFSTVFNNYFLPPVLPDKMDTSEAEQRTYSLLKGDVLLTRTSETLDELGMSSVAAKDYPMATFSGFLKRLRPIKKDIAYHKFMAFYLRSPLFRKAMNNNAVMTLRCSLNEEIFSYLSVLLPDLDQQIKIGDFLYQLYEKIELNQRMTKELEGMAKLLFDYWFVQFDFPMNAAQAAALGKPQLAGKPYRASGGKMTYNQVLKREIPERWGARKLSEIGTFKNGINYSPRDVGDTISHIINVRNMSSSSFFVDTSSLDQISLIGKSVKNYLVNENSVLIARSGIPGATRLVRNIKDNTIYCGFVICFEANSVKDRNLVFFHMKFIEKAITSNSAGTILKNVSQDTLKALCIPFPESNGQDRTLDNFNAIIDPIFGKLGNLQLENHELTRLRDWLLPMLMNGQLKAS